jgi:hypothetical protein
MRRLDELPHMELQITVAQTFKVVAETSAAAQTMSAETFLVAETRAEVQNVRTMVGAILGVFRAAVRSPLIMMHSPMSI